MLKLASKFKGTGWKAICRQLGTNFVTASFIGIFVTHIADMTIFAFFMLFWLGLIGYLLIFWGLRQ